MVGVSKGGARTDLKFKDPTQTPHFLCCSYCTCCGYADPTSLSPSLRLSTPNVMTRLGVRFSMSRNIPDFVFSLLETIFLNGQNVYFKRVQPFRDAAISVSIQQSIFSTQSSISISLLFPSQFSHFAEIRAFRQASCLEWAFEDSYSTSHSTRWVCMRKQSNVGRPTFDCFRIHTEFVCFGSCTL